MTGPDDLPQVDPEEAIARVAQGAVLLDVRELNEWDLGHAPDARLLPLSELQARVSELPIDQPVLIICHSGMRSMRATAFLRSEGVDAINVIGGMVAWAQVGGAITPNPADV